MGNVDIIVPVYGGEEHLRRLIPALRATAEKQNVIFYDDCTPVKKGQKQIHELLSNLPRSWRVVVGEKNLGFAGSNNAAAALGKSRYICMLNSDTEPTPGWLEYMLQVIENSSSVGIVGAKLLFPLWLTDDSLRPPGKVQHAGVVFNPARMPYHIFAGWNSKHPKVNRPLLLKAVTGACLLVKRRTFEKIGGLNPEYGQGNFEDIEFCLRAGQMGLDSAYCPKAVVYHFASGSDNTRDAEKNQMLFLHKWEDKIVCDDWLYW